MGEDLKLLTMQSPSVQSSGAQRHNTPQLPNEIWLQIIDLVHSKGEKKSIRLTSRLLCDLVSGSLFDNAYVSPSDKDLEIFNKIASTPHISKHITTIKYDTLIFEQEMTKERYLKDLLEVTQQNLV